MQGTVGDRGEDSDHGEDEISFFKDAFEATSALAERLAKTRLAAQGTTVVAMCDAVGPLVYVGQDGRSWSEGLPREGTSIKQFHEHASKTLLKAKGSLIENSANKSENAMNRYAALRDMHGQPMPKDNIPEFIERGRSSVTQARATKFEAVILSKMGEDWNNPIKAKNMVLGQLRKTEGSKRTSLIHPDLLATCAMAKGMVLKWQ